MKNEYKEIARSDISDSRSIVISSYSKSKGFTLAQQVKVKEGDKITNVFMKGAFHIDDVNGLYDIRDAINLAINKIENGELDDNIEWDE